MLVVGEEVSFPKRELRDANSMQLRRRSRISIRVVCLIVPREWLSFDSSGREEFGLRKLK
jgi:hypothetical protein